MISDLEIHNLGPLAAQSWQPGPGFNVIIGVNDSGKTLLLKALYAAVRASEEAGRGDDPRSFREVLDDKLTWTFQLARLGDLVRKGESASACSLQMQLDQEPVSFRFTDSARKGVGEAVGPCKNRSAQSIFVPAKEVLSMTGVIKESRLQQKFGFDDPTFDLVRALEASPTQGKPPFGKARPELEKLIQGRIQEKTGRGWIFRSSGGFEYPVSITAEGIKKIAIIDRLIVNRTLSDESLLFIDEPESFLHPRAAVELINILNRLVADGVQIIMATHSYFVLKKLMLLARESGLSVPVLSLSERGSEGTSAQADLADGMPDNPIVSTSFALYEQELEIEMDG
jgi:energy-coupling factor transporter ATP-binding protein EcfA2